MLRARALEQALRKLINAAVQTASKIAEDGDRRWHVVDLVCATNDAEKVLAVVPPPSGASPQAEASEDEDDVPLADSWSAPLRKPVVPKILSTDDFYALLRILEVLPVADPFLTDLQSKLSDEERRQHGNRASHLSGPEFVREIERIEALIQSRLPAPVSPVEPTTCPKCRSNTRAYRLAVADVIDGRMAGMTSCRDEWHSRLPMVSPVEPEPPTGVR